jgi:hypothetical protein
MAALRTIVRDGYFTIRLRLCVSEYVTTATKSLPDLGGGG